MTIDNETPVELRSPGPAYSEILEGDARRAPAHFFEESPLPPGPTTGPVERYTSRDWYETEKQRVWRQTWQATCREEHIPDVGDTYVYDICDMSFLIVRSAADEIKAYWNVCRHRGRQLQSEPCRTDVLRCPFHGFAWDLDGDLAFVPSEWDFPDLDRQEMRLIEVQVDTWAGFVFINPDPGAEALGDYLGEIVEHFEPWALEDRYVEVHVAKVIEANWKAVQEAFMESFHVAATHPQQLVRLGDTNSQHDCYGNFNRSLHPSGIPSPLLDWAPTEQEMLDNMLDVREGEPSLVPLPEGATLREFAAEIGRSSLRPAIGDRADEISDAELVDAIEYSVFPNFHPWAAFQRVVYRFRPHQDRHDQTVMEVIMLSPFDGDRPAPAEPIWLDAAASWTEAEVLGITGRILDQDLYNLPKVQIGMRSAPMENLKLASYQESRIRHFNELLDGYMNAGDTD